MNTANVTQQPAVLQQRARYENPFCDFQQAAPFNMEDYEMGTLSMTQKNSNVSLCLGPDGKVRYGTAVTCLKPCSGSSQSGLVCEAELLVKELIAKNFFDESLNFHNDVGQKLSAHATNMTTQCLKIGPKNLLRSIKKDVQNGEKVEQNPKSIQIYRDVKALKDNKDGILTNGLKYLQHDCQQYQVGLVWEFLEAYGIPQLSEFPSLDQCEKQVLALIAKYTPSDEPCNRLAANPEMYYREFPFAMKLLRMFAIAAFVNAYMCQNTRPTCGLVPGAKQKKAFCIALYAGIDPFQNRQRQSAPMAVNVMNPMNSFKDLAAAFNRVSKAGNQNSDAIALNPISAALSRRRPSKGRTQSLSSAPASADVFFTPLTASGPSLKKKKSMKKKKSRSVGAMNVAIGKVKARKQLKKRK